LRNKGKNETGVEQRCRNRENGIIPDGLGKKEGRQKLMQTGRSDKRRNERIQGSSSSSVICKTTGPKPLPKRFLHIVRSRASSFN